MPHYLPEIVVEGIGEIPAAMIVDEVSIAEDTLNRSGATVAYRLHAKRLSEIGASRTARSRVATTLLDYIMARMELEHAN